MNRLNKNTLLKKYMTDTSDDEGVINFINSEECTIQMINYEDEDGRSALNLAAKLSRHEVVEALIKKGADVNQVNLDAMNPLMFAIDEGEYYDAESIEKNLKTIDLLISAGTDLNSNIKGTAFTLACQAGKNKVISRLLEHDIDISIEDESGTTGMDYLQEDENEEGIKLVESYILNKQLESELSNKNNQIKKLKV